MSSVHFCCKSTADASTTVTFTVVVTGGVNTTIINATAIEVVVLNSSACWTGGSPLSESADNTLTITSIAYLPKTWIMSTFGGRSCPLWAILALLFYISVAVR